MFTRVRYRRGFVGERERLVHLIVGELATRGALVALCGTEIARDGYEVLGDFTGMPCIVCLSRAPDEKPAEITTDAFRISGP